MIILGKCRFIETLEYSDDGRRQIGWLHDQQLKQTGYNMNESLNKKADSSGKRGYINDSLDTRKRAT